MSDQLNNNNPEQVVQEQPAQQEQQKSQDSRDFKRLKEQKEESDRRAKEAERRIADMERYIQMQQQQAKPAVKEEDDLNLNDDDYLQGSQLRQYNKKLKQELQELKSQVAEVGQQATRAALKYEAPDYEKVCTEENLEKLKRMYPDEYNSLMYNPNAISRTKAATNLIKNYKIYNEDESDSFAEVDKRIENNMKKPKAAPSVPAQQAETPLTRFGDHDRRILTDADKKRNMERVHAFKSVYQQ